MIYHIATSADWTLHQHDATYTPSTYPQEGFIHCSRQEQVQGVVQRYFAGRTDLVLLHIDETKLTAELKYEAATNQELFPHVYGPINRNAIVKIERL